MKARRRVPARGPWGLLSASRAQNIEAPPATPLNEVKLRLGAEHPQTVGCSQQPSGPEEFVSLSFVQQLPEARND